MEAAESRGLIGRSFEDGSRVIWRFVNELPAEGVRAGLPWLTVVKWPYDGSAHDGFPDEATKAAMDRCESGLDPLEDSAASRSVYARIGNGLREWVFYAASQEAFLAALNDSLADHERYPLDVRFFNDADWSDFRKLLADFGQPLAS